MSTILLADVKAALDKSLNVDDVELQRLIDAAEAEYTDWVGPLTGTVTDKLDGGGESLVLRSPRVGAITAAAYSDGTTISLTDLDLDGSTGIVHWNYGTTGRFRSGTRNVLITYTVAAPPAHHREAIIADVAGYFAVTQRGPSALPGEGYDAAYVATPQVLFPRIRALAVPSVA